MLSIVIPSKFLKERTYIINTLFNFLGLKYSINVQNVSDGYIKISYPENRCVKKLHIKDTFFSIETHKWLDRQTLPKQPLTKCNVSEINALCNVFLNNVPVIYGDDLEGSKIFLFDGNKIILNLDIFGSAFFMLTRYEELINPERDEHGRFPATASLAYQEGFLDRPIINEYVEILWQCMKYLWPNLKRIKSEFNISLSHDVDTPYQYLYLPFANIIKNCLGDIVNRNDFRLSLNRFNKWFEVKRGNLDEDPKNKFDFIMDVSEKYNLKSTFFFQTENSSSFDGDYPVSHPYIKKLIKHISDRGHEIGLHPSYESYRNPEQVKKEYRILRETCDQLGIKQGVWGGRQHYLRWQAPYTWQSYEDAGLDYDSSLSFADHIGFRCGICFEFPVFNLLTREELSLIERPLIAMECSLLDDKYMGLEYDAAYSKLKKLIDSCKYFNGEFSLLWHNDRLIEKKDIELYLKIIDSLIRRS